ncbi:MAG TPA: hypothetical protein VIR55_12910 [Ignavibacteria bacterium]|jgi:quinol monooxygenase YgiN
MSKIILTVNYEVIPEKREEFLETMKIMKEKILAMNICSYSLYEQMGRKNKFSEIFIFNSNEDYDKFDEREDELEELVDKVNSEFVKEGRINSTQIIEVL